MKKILIFIILLVLFNCRQAYAYFDPGSGGYLLAAIWGYIVSVVVFSFSAIGLFFRNKVATILKAFFSKIKKCKIWIGFIVACLITSSIFFIHHKKSDKNEILAINYKREQPNLYGKKASFVCYNPQRSYRGYDYLDGNLYDRNGKIIHSWRKKGLYFGSIDRNGDLYASLGYAGWGKFDWNGRLIWQKNYFIHHELLLRDNKIFVFIREKHQYKGRSVAFDVIVVLDKDGNELDRWSAWDDFNELHKFHALRSLDVPFLHIKTFPKAAFHPSMDGASYEYYHLNSLQIIPHNSREGEHPLFNQGNWLISLRNVSMICILDKNTKKVLWNITAKDINGGIDNQHGPLMLPNGNVLIFDNGMYRKWSRVVEIDPITRQIVWEYKQDNFFTIIEGYAQPLPNGNILVTESMKAHAFEITRDKEMVWEYYRERKKSSKNKKKSSRRSLYRLIRYSPEQIEPLLKQYADQK